MLGRILNFLAWAGLYRANLVVLNVNNEPPSDVRLTPTEVADTAATFMETLVEKFVSEDGQKVSYLALKENPFYRSNLQDFKALLKVVDPSQMEEQERKTFFINLYNILTIDALLSMASLPSSTLSVGSFWSKYAYQVGEYKFHLDDIEHGILRGNRAHPVSSKIMFKANDPRLPLSVGPDHRIHAALNCGAASCPPLRAYKSEPLESHLDSALKDFCNKGVILDGSDLVINSIFKWFTNDFATSQKATLRFLSECVDEVKMQDALVDAAEGRRSYTFHYNWSLNAM